MAILLRTLGHIDLRDAAGAELRGLLTQPKRLAVLLYLASSTIDRLCRRDTLLAMFWPESDEEHGRASLRQALHVIRQELGPDTLITRGAEEIGVRSGAITLDCAELERLASRGLSVEALAQYRGDFLDGFFVRGAPMFERWVEGERDRLRRHAAEAAWAVVESQLAGGELDVARATAERAVRLSADSEVAVRRFITILARSGDHAAAAMAYQGFAAELAAEFGVRPSDETNLLFESLAQPGRPLAPLAPLTPRVPRATPSTNDALTADTPIHAASLAQSPPGRRPRKGMVGRVIRWATGGALIGLVAFAAVRSNALSAHAGSPADVRNVAVLPFAVSGDASLRYLRDGLPLLLSTRLDGVAKMHAVDTRAVLLEQSRRGGDSLASAAASTTASRLGAQFYVVGSVVGTAAALHVDVSLFDRRQASAAIARAQVDGPESDLIALVDAAAKQLLADRFRESGGLVSEMAARTTTSFVALRAWLEGESSLTAGRYEPAMAFFRAALSADSSFAMAWYRLAVAAAWAGDAVTVTTAIAKAVARSDRLPPTARTIIEAFSNSRRGAYVEAERQERALLAERPTSIDVWFDLGELLYHGNPGRGRPIDDARAAFEEVLRMDPRSFAAQVHLARLAAARGDGIALDSLTRAALSSEPDGPHRAELLLLRFLALHDEAARRVFLSSRVEPAMMDAMWRAAEYTENLRDADELARGLLRRPATREMRAALFLFLSHDAIGRERFSLAEEYLDSLATYAPGYAAVATSIAARHPAAGAARGTLVARARVRVAAADSGASGARIYVGSSREDDTRPFSTFEATELALVTTGTPADSAAARALLRRSATDDAQGDDQTGRTMLSLSLASTATESDEALRGVAALDSLNGNHPATQTPLAPRAELQLCALPLLERAGRRREALARLATVPEDFGFNLAYLAEVHRRRAALLTALGHAQRASEERAAVERIVRD